MQRDICQADISLVTKEALDSWNAMVRAFLAHGTTAAEHLGQVISTEPEFAMAHAAKGLFSLMMGRRELVGVAGDAHIAAKIALKEGTATSRERAYVVALGAWLGGQPSGAIDAMETVLRDNPADTLTMKISHAIRFILGDNYGMRQSIEAVIGAHGADHPLSGYAYGCHAFTLEETGEYALAEQAGKTGLELASDDAWGLHAVAHVYDMTHRPDLGISLIEDNQSAWSHCNNFRFHVWWHKALLHLDRGEIETVLRLYDTKIREEKTDDYRDFSNASSLLMRLELEGVDVGGRWEELANLAETRSEDGCLVFADLHYMLALVGDNRPDAVARLTARVAASGQNQDEVAQVFADPGLNAAEGLAAFGEGRYDVAYQFLNTARPIFQTMGGSHAQRDVFERVTIDAAIRAGRLDAAEVLLAERTRLRANKADAFTDARHHSIGDARRIRASFAAQ